VIRPACQGDVFSKQVRTLRRSQPGVSREFDQVGGIRVLRHRSLNFRELRFFVISIAGTEDFSVCIEN